MRLSSVVFCAVFTVLSMSLGGLQISAHAAPPSDAFGQLPQIHDAALSPDSKRIAIIRNIDGQYYVSIGPKGAKGQIKPKLLGLGKGVKPSYIKWVNNDRVFVIFWQSEVYRSTPFTSSFIYSVNASTLKGKVLLRPEEDVFRQDNSRIVDWLDDEPDYILMAFDPSKNNARPGLYRVNVATGAKKIVKRGKRDVQHWVTDNSGTPRIARGRRDDKEATKVMKVLLAGTEKWLDSLEFPGLSAGAKVHGFTENPNEIIISSYQGRDTIGLYGYDLSQRKISRKIYHNDEFDASSVVRASKTNEVIGVKYTADTTKTELLGEHATLLESLRQKFPKHNVSFVDEAANGQAILANVSGPTDSGYMMILEAGADEPRGLGALYPDLKSQDLGTVISVKYTARDGQKIPSYVTLPPTITDSAQLKDMPFIILPHGGPYSRDAKRFDYFAQFFASRGYGVLQMNFRGSEGFGKAFKEAGRKNWVVMQEDVEDGARWLYEKGYADPERTCIAGWSYGGYAALMGAGKHPDLYKCAISMAGVTDIAGIIRDQGRYRFGKASAKKFVGAGFTDKDDQKANSPVKLAEDMTVPIFLAHGVRDQRVDFSQYVRMKRALKKSKAKVTTMEFAGEDHFLSNQANRQKFFKGLDKFLNKVNGKSEFMAP